MPPGAPPPLNCIPQNVGSEPSRNSSWGWVFPYFTYVGFTPADKCGPFISLFPRSWPEGRDEPPPPPPHWLGPLWARHALRDDDLRPVRHPREPPPPRPAERCPGVGKGRVVICTPPPTSQMLPSTPQGTLDNQLVNPCPTAHPPPRPERRAASPRCLPQKLRPGGWLFFRDYAEDDMTQRRFRPSAQVAANTFRRHDGAPPTAG